jgi:diguanylate cyclase (GGDEF)-like protein
MGHSYHLNLVALSLIVSILASYTALDVSRRVGTIRAAGRHHLLWLLGGAVALGVGIWSMHFIGMLAFSMPMEVGYDPWITGYSLLIAIAVSYLAMYVVVSNDQLSRGAIAGGGLLMGLGIAGMHYTGMSAMLMQPALRYDPWRLSASIAIAVLASWAALWIAFSLRNSDQGYFLLKRILAAVVMGFAIAGMHYTGMSAMIVAQGAVCGAARGMDTTQLALAVAGGTLAVMALTMFFFLLEMRFSLVALDALTGLQNRATFMRRVERVINTSRRRGRPFALLFMDLDGFKLVNDSCGHMVGDMVLKDFAQQLRRHTRNTNILARLGGDEFVLLMPELSNVDDAGALAATITSRMPDSIIDELTPVHVTASVGIALFPQDGDSAEDLLKNADTAMYGAKEQGRNTYRFFEVGMRAAADRVQAIQRGLEEAIAKQQLSLHFQAQFDSSTQTLDSAEALLRWRHPELGEIPPGEFIPIAERSGHIIPIGNWVIREACAQMQRWESAGLPSIRIALNLSPHQLRQPNCVERIHAIFVETGVSAHRVTFEITETVAMQDAEKTTAMIHHFQSLGFDVAIDDFGTGYSSLAYLQQFRSKQLKMDKFFTQGLDHHGEEGLALVTAIIALAHSLKMDVVAEGVETRSQLEHLQALACDHVQGFLLSQPLNTMDFEDLLRTHWECVPDSPMDAAASRRT